MNSYVDRTRLALFGVDISVALRGECYLSTKSWELHPRIYLDLLEDHHERVSRKRVIRLMRSGASFGPLQKT